jgi:hypothetical protein
MASGDAEPETQITEPGLEPETRNTKHETWRVLDWPLLLSHQISTVKLSEFYLERTLDSSLRRERATQHPPVFFSPTYPGDIPGGIHSNGYDLYQVRFDGQFSDVTGGCYVGSGFVEVGHTIRRV